MWKQRVFTHHVTIFSYAISVSSLVDMASGKLKDNVFYLSRDLMLPRPQNNMLLLSSSYHKLPSSLV